MTSVTCERVSVWRHPDADVHHIGPAELSCSDDADAATLTVSAPNVPEGLTLAETAGWPIHCSSEDGTVFEGGIEAVDTQISYCGKEYVLDVVPPVIQTP